jgi:hypothetical protein
MRGFLICVTSTHIQNLHRLPFYFSLLFKNYTIHRPFSLSFSTLHYLRYEDGACKCLRKILRCYSPVDSTSITHSRSSDNFRSQAVRNYSVAYRHRLDDHPNRLANSLLQRTIYNRRLKWYYPADLATRF